MKSLKFRRRFLFAAVLLIILGGLIAVRYLVPYRAPKDVVTLVRVADGDTLVVKDAAGHQVKVRLIGVDAPELGTAASFRSALLVAELCEKAQQIRLEREPKRPADKYGRVLAWVWLTMPDGSKRLLNAEMIHSGNAKLYEPTSSTVKYYNRLR